MKKLLSLICCGLFFQLQAQINTGKRIFPKDSCLFETPCQLIVLDTMSRGLWEITQPAKSPFDSAYSPVNAIITDANNPYPVNNDSYFEVKLPNYNGLSSVLSFWHKIDTDSAKDGGYIEVSHDQGQTWENVVDEVNAPQFLEFHRENLYENTDTLYKGISGFSGSVAWEEVKIQWIYALVVKKMEIPDTSLLRFHFVSDSIDTQKAGWMIDDIRIYSVDFPGSVSSGIDKVAIHIAPHPITDNSRISFENYKQQAYHFELMNAHGQVVYQKENIRTSEFMLEKGTLSSGMYFMRLSFEGEVLATQKILIRN